jgi:N-acetylmuramoyl-L-alanine amidase
MVFWFRLFYTFKKFLSHSNIFTCCVLNNPYTFALSMLTKHITKAILLISSIFAVLALTVCTASAQTKRNKTDDNEAGTVSPFRFKTIVIDPGHGGKDPGAHGAYSNEKSVALSIAKKLKEAINDQLDNVNVILTRSTDKFIELHRRADIANENNANLFISIHCNSTPERIGSRKGALLLVYGFHRKQEQLEALRENASIFIEKDYQKKYNGYGDDAAVNAIVLAAFQQRYRKQSIQFGDLLNTEFKDTDGRRTAGVKEQGVLVLQQSGMPGLLIETGFINNPDDERYLNSNEGQSVIVQSIIRAIKKYKDNLNR